MEKKQTAVEWLIDQLFKQGYFDGNKPLSITSLDHLQHQAKEMEKEQLIECFLEADADAYRKEPKYKTPQDYIRQTYEHNNQH